MKKLGFIICFLLISLLILLFFSCKGTALTLLEENATLTISVIWPTKSAAVSKLIPSETTNIAFFISNDNMASYKKATLISKDSGNQTLSWNLYPGNYTISILALEYKSSTTSGLKNYLILTGNVTKISLSAGENKDLSITLSNIDITAQLAFEPSHVFYLNEAIPIKFNIGNFNSVLKFSGGKLYFKYNNGFSNITEYKTIYVSNTQELSDGSFLSTVYPDNNGYPSNDFDLSVYAKFTVASDKIATDFMTYYQINEIKVEISNYPLGHLTDGTQTANLNITIQ